MKGRAQYFSRTGFLYQGHEANVFWIGAGLQLQLNVLSEILALRQLPDFGEFLHYRDMNQVASAVFSAQHLRLDMVKSDGYENLGIVLFRIRIGLNVGVQDRWIPRVHRDIANAHTNLGSGGSLEQSVLNLFGIADFHFVRSVNYQLRSEDSLFSEYAFVGILALGQRRRRVRIFPAVLIPVGDMFTENDQLRARYRLPGVQFSDQPVGGRTR